MRVKVTEAILDYENKTLVEKDRNEAGEFIDRPVTWRVIIFNALNSVQPNEQPTAEEKLKAYQITKKTYDTNEPDFTSSELAFIFSKIQGIYNALIVGRASEVFDNPKEIAEIPAGTPQN